MDLTAQDYAEHLGWLLPEGPAWSDEIVGRLVTALAIEPARLDSRIADAVREADPRTAVQLLADWERVLGLPDKCTADAALSMAERQGIASAKFTAQGGQSRAYFIDLAARYGEPDVTIDEFRPMNCNDACTSIVYAEKVRYAWRVNIPRNVGLGVPMNCQSLCTAPLYRWEVSRAECPIRERKPAHTLVFFAYLGDAHVDLDFTLDVSALG